MPKIAMIGAGSVIFCKTLVNDILATPARICTGGVSDAFSGLRNQ